VFHTGERYGKSQISEAPMETQPPQKRDKQTQQIYLSHADKKIERGDQKQRQGICPKASSRNFFSYR